MDPRIREDGFTVGTGVSPVLKHARTHATQAEHKACPYVCSVGFQTCTRADTIKHWNAALLIFNLAQHWNAMLLYRTSNSDG
jgi:hypothetical protein